MSYAINKGMSGVPLTTIPPFGYKKNPDNLKECLVDEPAAEVVKRIFDMCVAGFGPTQILKKLKADKVMTPTEYGHSIGKPYRRLSTVPYRWSADTVGNILSRQEYIGDTVNFRITSKSFKNKKRLERLQEEWQIFKNTHPVIIDEETFLLVQELREHRRRPTRHGLSVCFRDCSTAPTVGKNCITMQ